MAAKGDRREGVESDGMRAVPRVPSHRPRPEKAVAFQS